MDLEKVPDVAYQDVLNEFDLTWGVKNHIVTPNNLVVTWMDKPHMGIVSWVHLGCVGLPESVVFWFFLAIESFNCYQNKKEKNF